MREGMKGRNFLRHLALDGPNRYFDANMLIREFDKTTPIVFYSGDHPSRLKKALDCDAQGFVLKPGFDALPRELERALATAV